MSSSLKDLLEQKAALDAKIAETHGIPTSDYPTPAKRPMNSRLDCSIALRDFGISMPSWRDSTRACVKRLLGEQATV